MKKFKVKKYTKWESDFEGHPAKVFRHEFEPINICSGDEWEMEFEHIYNKHGKLADVDLKNFKVNRKKV